MTELGRTCLRSAIATGLAYLWLRMAVGLRIRRRSWLLSFCVKLSQRQADAIAHFLIMAITLSIGYSCEESVQELQCAQTHGDIGLMWLFVIAVMLVMTPLVVRVLDWGKRKKHALQQSAGQFAPLLA